LKITGSANETGFDFGHRDETELSEKGFGTFWHTRGKRDVGESDGRENDQTHLESIGVVGRGGAILKRPTPCAQDGDQRIAELLCFQYLD